MKKATTLYEIDQAVQFNVPVGPDHPFYTDLSEVRGEFEERIVYKILNVKVDQHQFSYDYLRHSHHKTLLFLGGMRGSGKTSELAKYTQNLNSPNCFYCITCNLDEELDMNDVEYMDILILQLENLTAKLDHDSIPLSNRAIEGMMMWFEQRIEEINSNIKGEVGLTLKINLKKSLLGRMLDLFRELKIGIAGSKKRAKIIRNALKNKFGIFAIKFNQFIEEANLGIRKSNYGREILFIIDGLEKTLSQAISKKIIIEESNRIRRINVNTIFTLPLELMRFRHQINEFSQLESFPFVQMIDKNGKKLEKAFSTFQSFIYRRIDSSLFENEEVVNSIIEYCGGSPRQLLRIIETASFYADEKLGFIDHLALDKALHRLSSQMAQYITQEQLIKIRQIMANNQSNDYTLFDNIMQELLENIIIMEYDDGNLRLINPLLKLSKLDI